MSMWFSGSKKKMFAVTAVAAMSAMLLFAVCSDDENPNDDGDKKWCGWTKGDPTNCQAIEDGMNAENPEKTNLEACQEFGTVYADEATCKATEAATTPPQWCAWDRSNPDECHPMKEPDATNPENPDMTNLEVCQEYGFVYASEAACKAGEATVTMQYCDWGEGGCWPIHNPDQPNKENPQYTNYENCVAYGLVVSSCN